MTELKDVNFGINQYCGPSVLSILTGESTDRCAAVISAVSGKKEIKAVERAHLKEALKRLRFAVLEKGMYISSTLYGSLFKIRNADGLYIIFVPHHVVAVEVKAGNIYICDNHTKTPIEIRQSARLAQKVEDVWKVVPVEPPKFIKAEIRTIVNPNGMDIWSYNFYERPEDNTKFHLGHIRYVDKMELRQIIEAMKHEL